MADFRVYIRTAVESGTRSERESTAIQAQRLSPLARVDLEQIADLSIAEIAAKRKWHIDPDAI